MIGIIYATENEMNPIKQHMIIKKSTVHALLTIHEGSIADKEVVLLYSGVCKVNAALATQLIIDTYKPHLIIMAGVAGSIDEKVKIFDTIIDCSDNYRYM